MTQGAIWAGLSRVALGDWRAGGSGGFARSTAGVRARRAMRGRRLALVAGLAAGGVLLLAGCGNSPPEPQQTFAEVTASPTPSPGPTPSALTAAVPVRPAEMERSDEAGAAAATTYFMRLFEYVLQTGDHEEWDEIGVPDCNFCSNVRERADRIYGANGRILGGEMELGSAELLVYEEQLGVYAFSVPYAFASGAETDSTGKTITSVEADQGALVLEVIYSAGGWTLLGGSRDEEADN